MSEKKTVLVDLDGVLCDFVSSVCKILNATYPDPWPSSVYSIADALGITESEMWKAIDKEGYQFWANLEPYPYAKELYERLQYEYEVFFCSTPSQSPESLKGKLLWLNKFSGTNCRNYIFTPKKSLLSRKGTILIDDYDKNCNEFEQGKGQSVLWPCDWNTNYLFKDNQFEYLNVKLDKINDYIEMQNDMDGTNNYKGT